MKYRFLSFFTILLTGIYLLSGCGMSGTDSAAINAVDSTDSANSADSADWADQTGTVTWMMPSGYGNLHVDALNEQLRNNGYDIQLEISYLDENNYYSLLQENLESGDADIVSMAFLEADQIADLVRANDLYELSDYLNSDSGKALRDAFYDEVWTTVSIDNSICLIPNQVGQDGTGYYAFNKSYFTEEELADFDGTPEGLCELLLQKEVSDINVIWDWDTYQLAYTSRQQYAYGVLLDCETGEVSNLHESSAFLQQADALRQMLSLGYLGENGKYYQMDTTQIYTDKISNLDFAVWVGTDASLLYEQIKEDVITVQAPFAFINRVQWSAGVSSRSAKTGAALQLLTLLYTDESYANLLVCGIEGTNYEVNDGYAVYYDSDSSLSINEMVTGLFDLIVPLEEDSFPIERLETKWSLYDQAGRQASVVTGFYPDTTAISVDLDYFETVSSLAAEKYIAGKSTLEELQSSLEENNAGTVKNELQEQITAYLNET